MLFFIHKSTVAKHGFSVNTIMTVNVIIAIIQFKTVYTVYHLLKRIIFWKFYYYDSLMNVYEPNQEIVIEQLTLMILASLLFMKLLSVHTVSLVDHPNFALSSLTRRKNQSDMINTFEFFYKVTVGNFIIFPYTCAIKLNKLQIITQVEYLHSLLNIFEKNSELIGNYSLS